MNLPTLDRKTYDVSVDSITVKLKEPTLEQVEKIASIKNIGEEKELVAKIAEILASLMDSYDSTIKEKEDFIKNMSYRQLSILTDNLTNAVQEKKVVAGSEELNSSSQEKQAGL